jgi:ClpP class serine protease
MNRTWPQTLADLARAAFWLLLIVIVLLQFLVGPRGTDSARREALQRFEQERKTRVIALIHRQDQVNVLGVPVTSYIDIEDSEAVLRAIRLTPDEQPIDLILHTPGGLVLAAEQIARALAERKAKVTVFVPHYAMSGGTLIALAADEIVMDANAVLGQVDPQIGELPAASIVRAVEIKRPQGVSDEMLVLADMAQKARIQVRAFVAQLLSKRMPKDQAQKLAALLSEGRWTHDFPITVQMARELGLPVSTGMPRAVYELMERRATACGRRSSTHRDPSAPSRRRRLSPGARAPRSNSATSWSPRWL